MEYLLLFIFTFFICMLPYIVPSFKNYFNYHNYKWHVGKRMMEWKHSMFTIGNGKEAGLVSF